MAKSRAQRKAERRKREQQQAQQADRERRDESRAQQRTQVPESANVVEAELAEHGVDIDDLRETTQEPDAEAPAPSRADVGAPAEAEAPPAESRRERKRREREEARAKEERRQAREKKAKAAEAPERKRGAVLGFLASSWAELRRVQWPDREKLMQGSAVTLIFVATMAAYLGALDAIFNELVQLIII